MAKLRYTQLTDIPQDSVLGLKGELDAKASASSSPKEIYVDLVDGDDGNLGDREFPKKTIQAAVDSLPLVINHPIEIKLSKGIYSETVTFTNHLLGAEGFIIIRPQRGASVVLSGDQKLEHCVIVDFAQGVCFRDITIQGYTKEAVKVINSAKIDMNRCVMRDNHTALLISNQASTYSLNSCVFLNNRVGVKVLNTSNAEITDSCFESNSIAVSVESLSAVNLVGSTVASNTLAFQSLSRSNLNINASMITGNDNVAQVDLSTLSSRNSHGQTVISNNKFGLLAVKSSVVDLKNVTMSDNSHVDIALESASTALVEDCDISKANKVFSFSVKRGSQLHMLGNTRSHSSSPTLYDPMQSDQIFG